MTNEKQDLDPLGLGWRLIGHWIRYDSAQDRHLMDGSHSDLANMFVPLYRRALGMKAERDRWHEMFNAVTGEGAPTPADAEAGAPETPGAPSPTTRALTGEDIEQAVNEILRRHKELHDEGERLLKLAPEMPPLIPDDPLSSETVRAHDRGMRAFDARLANLEEATAALERRLDDLSLIRDKQQGSDD